MPAAITTLPPAAPSQPPDWGFAEWWASWEKVCEALNPGRVGDRREALKAWKTAGHAADPKLPRQHLNTWAGRNEWKDPERAAIPNPEKFLTNHKYCPPRKQAWRPSAALQELPHEIWCRALLDAEQTLKQRNLLSGDAGESRRAVLARSADDRTCLLNRFWHDLIGETPTVRAHELYGPRSVA